MAAERRLLALQQATSTTAAKSEGESDTDEDNPPETDQDRRRTMLEAMSKGDIGNLKASARDFADDFLLPSAGPSSQDSAGAPCDVQRLHVSGSTGTSSSSQIPTSKPKGKAPMTGSASSSKRASISDYMDSVPPGKKPKLSYGALVEGEVNHRKKEALGMVDSGRKLRVTSSLPQSAPSQERAKHSTSKLLDLVPDKAPALSRGPSARGSEPWACKVCTL